MKRIAAVVLVAVVAMTPWMMGSESGDGSRVADAGPVETGRNADVAWTGLGQASGAEPAWRAFVPADFEPPRTGHAAARGIDVLGRSTAATDVSGCATDTAAYMIPGLDGLGSDDACAYALIEGGYGRFAMACEGVGSCWAFTGNWWVWVIYGCEAGAAAAWVWDVDERHLGHDGCAVYSAHWGAPQDWGSFVGYLWTSADAQVAAVAHAPLE